MYQVYPQTKESKKVATWYSAFFPASSKLFGMEGLIQLCYIYLPKYMGPFGGFHGVKGSHQCQLLPKFYLGDTWAEEFNLFKTQPFYYPRK